MVERKTPTGARTARRPPGAWRRRVRAVLARPRAYTAHGALSLAWRFAVRFVAFYLGFAAAIYLAAHPATVDGTALWASFTGNARLLAGLSTAASLLDLVKDSVSASLRSAGEPWSRIALGYLTGTIDEWPGLTSGSLDVAMSRLLPRIERSVSAVLAEHGVPGPVTANLMVVVGGELVLTYWGTRGADRENIRLPCSTGPGAPEAYRRRETIYVSDTQDPEHEGQFAPGRPYRSVLCVPIPQSRSGNVAVRAVLNLDSPDVEGLGSADLVECEVLPCLRPWLSLLEQRL